MSSNHPSTRRQRGVAALVVTILLFSAMLLVVAFTNRNLVVEARSSANQYRSAQAFEAAEAGLEWALAKLNDTSRIGTDCRPSAAAGAATFRDSHLRFDATFGGLAPVTWDDGGTPAALRAACVRLASGWTCSCPTSGAPVLPAAPSGTTAPAFAVEIAAGAKPGIVRAVATGCTNGNGVCAPTSDADHEAAARVEVAFGLLPGLRAAPVAALTAGGHVDAASAALGVHNRDVAAGGIAIHAGGTVAGSALRLSAPAGSPLAAAIVTGDAALGALDHDRLFARYFGMTQAAWLAQPAVTRVACDACASPIAAAIDAGSTLLAVTGDLAVDGPITLGSPERPVVIAASGALRLRGAVTVHGLVYGASLDWRDGAAGAMVLGAAIAAANYSGNVDADIVYDTATLARLKGGSGSFVRVTGSWKDF